MDLLSVGFIDLLMDGWIYLWIDGFIDRLMDFLMDWLYYSGVTGGSFDPFFIQCLE